jgi:hypothetical protein
MTGNVMVSDPGPRGEGRMPQGQEHEGRRKYLPRELRIKLYEEVNRLRRDGPDGITPIRPDRRKNNLLSGDVLRGPRPPGKAMTEEVMVQDPGPRGEDDGHKC